jgi:hypothetical protein
LSSYFATALSRTDDLLKRSREDSLTLSRELGNVCLRIIGEKEQAGSMDSKRFSKLGKIAGIDQRALESVARFSATLSTPRHDMSELYARVRNVLRERGWFLEYD